MLGSTKNSKPIGWGGEESNTKNLPKFFDFSDFSENLGKVAPKYDKNFV